MSKRDEVPAKSRLKGVNQNLQPAANLSSKLPRVAIVDDHPVLVSFLTQLLERDGRYEIVGRAETSIDALELCRRTKPAVVILDIGLLDSDNLDCLRSIRHDCPQARVLVFTGRLTTALVHDMLVAGATGIMGKIAKLQDILEAVDRVARGEIHLCPQASEAVRSIVREPRREALPAEPRLSRRELTVLRYIATGLSSRQIATKMELSQNTINAFRGRLMKKTGQHDAVNLSLYAVRLGLLGSATPFQSVK